ncbi:HAD-IIA family hydrolase [Nocardioides sp. B-3]|uniref:HAD-IIA family hydrolase n=1 Tax=Nocardioides sp. B-3 TaxID=2895565 RepID=UPI0021527614|nr:HAD-IIA family hydrolase [Nocardioides sp. B-3]UUZ58996.1 HAD-IIA family hydrolase [Nocardioides sp. B-3]
MLKASEVPLLEGYDLTMFDLDGVVYVSGRAIDGVAERLQRVRDAGVHPAFVTNNASRTPEKVAANPVKLGVAATAADVVTSARAAARVIKDRFGPGSRVLLLGGAGLEAAPAAEGLEVITESGEAVAIVSGYGPDVLWKDIMRAATLIRDGLPYVASNTDLTIPTDYGLAPGHGVLVRTLADFAGVEAIVAGKPARPLMDETIRRVGGDRPLMVGDRLDTDIEGAHAVGVDSLLVMTGVTHLAELVAATPELRPSYISPDPAGLFEAHPVPEVDADGAQLGGWQARVEGGALKVAGEGSDADWWRVVAAASWAAPGRDRDRGRRGSVGATGPPRPDERR